MSLKQVGSASEKGKLTGFHPDLDIFVFELGNDMVKAASTALTGQASIVYFRHRFAQVSESQWLDAQDAAERAGATTYHLLKWRGNYYVIGDEALAYPGLMQMRQNIGKWERGYIGLIMMSAMLRMYEGRPPSDITLYVAHPPMLYQQTDTLLKATLGQWAVEYAGGGTVRVNVAYGEPYDEIMGGVFNKSLNGDGHPYAQGTFPVLGKGPTIVADLGGGTFDLAYLKKDGTVDYSRLMTSHAVGGNDALDSFRREVSRKYSDIIGGGEKGTGMVTWADTLDILRTPDRTFESVAKTYSCDAQFKRAFGPVITSASEFFRNRVPNFVGINCVLVTGGVYGLLFDEMNEALFKPFVSANTLFATERRDEMMLGNIRGAHKMALAKKMMIGGGTPRKRSK